MTVFSKSEIKTRKDFPKKGGGGNENLTGRGEGVIQENKMMETKKQKKYYKKLE